MGYHVPSALEWWDITCQWLQSLGKSCPSQTARAQFTWDSPATSEQFQNDFLLPLAGELDNNGNLKDETSNKIGAYRSSTRIIGSDAYELYFSPSTVIT
ncbi:MAG: hypothetical protein LBD75_08145 [Candidatus Peribacteria bacterium]|jgi:hypothetical protein|nr:hypothetical protein [Candidatus Peribacteria bacterium]